MPDREKIFEELYTEYKNLAVSTHIEAQIHRPGQSYKAYPLSPNELLRRKDIAKKLTENYKDFFKDKPDEWFDLVLDAR